MTSEHRNPFPEIVGNRLEAIASANHTYIGSGLAGSLSTTSVSLLFDRGRLEIENPFVLQIGEECLSSSNDQMSAQLNSLLGLEVTAAHISKEEISLVFENGASIQISLREADYVGPEAGNYAPKDGPTIVFN